ncbi:MAG: hypothetical protein IH624_12515 [Phycisphaerae bacterium]|nr:hypothetical protein [Phycisphaerae bacterium]
MKIWLCISAVVVFIVSGAQANKEYSWRQTHAAVSPTGDLTWAPRPFEFVRGGSVRYVDYDLGSDSSDGLTTRTAWKHHPWDRHATRNAKQCQGIHTYVFKRGVYYRGTLNALQSGTPDNPIRLTSDPAWGTGEAVISGGHRITKGWTKGAENQDIPEPDNVWYIDLDFAPRTLYLVEPSGRGASKDDKITRIPLARMPNWKESDPEDVKSEWWCWDNPGHPYFNLTMQAEGSEKVLAMGKDTKHITGPKDLYMGAILWAEFGWVDGTPYPSYVQGFDAEKRALGFEGYLGTATSRIISRNHRYYLEDKPHYLDDPEGEYWFEKRGPGGRLHVILPKGQNLNTAVLEAGKEATLIDVTGHNHIAVSGLTFRFANVSWDLTEVPWLYSQKFRLKQHIHPACVRVWGPADHITVANCTFEHVNNGVLMKAVNPGDRIDNIVVRDCEFRETDHNGITIEEGLLWGDTLPDRAGHLFDVKILRNYLYRTGLRSPRVGAANAINVDNAETLEIAGNIVEQAWHAGINVRGSKISGNVRDCPLTRILIYQNKVTDSIRTGDDCGNIETWQGGSAYVFNNVSGNPGGFRYGHWVSDQTSKTPGGARFGMAYYLDGAFKNYYFNNIGWGLSSDITSPHGATTMFQEIISYQNMFFNNTAYNFVKGTRRQAPQAGRNKFMGNIWDSIGDWVFWHTQPAKTPQDGNERDAGTVEKNYALQTNAFTGNVFHNITGKYGSFKSSGAWHRTFEECRTALEDVKSIAHDLGVVAGKPVMQDPANRDFRLTEDSAAIDQGVRCFVPWPLYATVAEWNFYPEGNDPTRIMDEHWYMTPYYYVRDDYYKAPMFPLTGINITKSNYVKGPLEDWTRGACTFNGLDQYAVCPNGELNKTLMIPIKFKWDQAGQKEDRTVTGRDFKSPQIWDSSFCIEAYFKTTSKGGVLIRKMADSGYGLTLGRSGELLFEVKVPGASFDLTSKKKVNDGKWHHVIAEADRAAETLTLYIDGVADVSGPGIGKRSIDNDSDLFVCGTPHGQYLKATLEFMRISLGTLRDAKTTIEELYAWQFDGPFLRDFAGREPRGKRDAGALESAN